MKQNITLFFLVVALGTSGCTSATQHLMNDPIDTSSSSNQTTIEYQHQPTYTYEEPTQEKKEAYENTMKKIASGIQDDPNYQRFSLDTEEKKAWFKKLTYQLWDRQITRQQFVEEGLKKYPNNGYEFDFIIKGFNAN